MELRKGVAIAFIALLTLCFASINLNLNTKVRGEVSTKLKIDPSSISANPGENFKVGINIESVTDLTSYDITFRWDSGLFKVKDVEEGPFMQNFGGTSFQTGIEEGSLYIGCSFLGPDTATGDGTLANVTFNVKNTGNCSLYFLVEGLQRTKLMHDYEEIPFLAFNMDFHTTMPVASFTMSPTEPLPRVGEFSRWGADVGEITFNASESYDPDGGSIASYYWDFGDGTNTTITNPITTHNYAQCRKTPYKINLTITDDDPQPNNWSRLNELLIWHDVAVTYIDTSDSDAFQFVNKTFPRGNPIWIRVSAKNDGSITETFNVTLYVDSVEINTTKITIKPQEYSLTKSLQYSVEDTLNLWSGNHTIKAEAQVVPRETETANNQYNVTVTMTGNATLKHHLVWTGYKFDIYTTTNSTVGQVNFDQPTKSINFTVTGPDGTAGFCNVTIPRNILDCPDSIDDWQILIGSTDISASCTKTRNDTHTFIYIPYTHSIQTITIKGTWAASPLAYITLSPEKGFASTTVVGAYFTPNATVAIAWDGVVVPTVPSKVVADNNGTFTAIITVPTQTAVGNHTVKATDTGGITSEEVFTVVDMTGLQGFQGFQGSRPPVADFTIKPAPPYYAPFTLTFNASTSLPGFNGTHNKPITSYAWNFGDGNVTTRTTPIITHTYSSNGTYIVTLKVTDSTGLFDTTSITVMTGPYKGEQGPPGEQGIAGADAPLYYVTASLALSIIAICLAAYAAYRIARKKPS
jgi:PKD repeat protein